MGFVSTASSPERSEGRGDGAERRRWRIQRGGGSPKQGVSRANSEVRRLCFGLVAAGSPGIFLGFALVQSATRTTRRKTEVRRLSSPCDHLIRLFACGENPPSPRGEGFSGRRGRRPLRITQKTVEIPSHPCYNDVVTQI